MKAVITTDSISLLPLRGRHHPFTRPRAATLSVAIIAYTIIWGNFADNHKIFSQNIRDMLPCRFLQFLRRTAAFSTKSHKTACPPNVGEKTEFAGAAGFNLLCYNLMTMCKL